MENDSKGEYVRFADYEAKCAEVERLTKERDETRGARDKAYLWASELEAKLASLRAKVPEITEQLTEAIWGVHFEDVTFDDVQARFTTVLNEYLGGKDGR